MERGPCLSLFARRRADTEIAGYAFSDERLATEALTHRSYRHEHPVEARLEDYERLEFLGDAVVGLVVAEDLYRRFPLAREGELTELRASLVSKGALAAVGTRLDLPGVALLGEGERASGRGRAGLAASLYESVVGAVYLDAGLDVARSFVERTLGDSLTEASLHRSAKMTLQEWAQATHGTKPLYRTVDTTGPSHQRAFVVEVEVAGVVASGSGPSKRAAEDAAASAALEGVKR